MEKRKPKKYTTPEEAEEARKVRTREANRRYYQAHKEKRLAQIRQYNEENKDRIKAYWKEKASIKREEKQKQSEQTYEIRSELKREKDRERQLRYRRENPEKRAAERQKVKTDVRSRVSVVVKTFALLPELAKEDYAHWLLLLSKYDWLTQKAMNNPKVDDLLGQYSGF